MQATLKKNQGNRYGGTTYGKNLCMYVSANRLHKLDEIDERWKSLGYSSRSDYFFAIYNHAIGVKDPIRGV